MGCGHFRRDPKGPPEGRFRSRQVTVFQMPKALCKQGFARFLFLTGLTSSPACGDAPESCQSSFSSW
jgi:hypothetical protein